MKLIREYILILLFLLASMTCTGGPLLSREEVSEISSRSRNIIAEMPLPLNILFNTFKNFQQTSVSSCVEKSGYLNYCSASIVETVSNTDIMNQALSPFGIPFVLNLERRQLHLLYKPLSNMSKRLQKIEIGPSVLLVPDVFNTTPIGDSIALVRMNNIYLRRAGDPCLLSYMHELGERIELYFRTGQTMNYRENPHGQIVHGSHAGPLAIIAELYAANYLRRFGTEEEKKELTYFVCRFRKLSGEYSAILNSVRKQIPNYEYGDSINGIDLDKLGTSLIQNYNSTISLWSDAWPLKQFFLFLLASQEKLSHVFGEVFDRYFPKGLVPSNAIQQLSDLHFGVDSFR